MTEQVVIALDAMGGDLGPDMVLPGAALALKRHPKIELRLYGDSNRLRSLLAQFPDVAAKASVHHAEIAVGMEDKPSQALLRGRRVSSMWQAIEAVKRGEAHVAVSAGNTGALMAMAKVILDTMPGIDRPAIAALWPTLKGESVVLDVGATIGADADQLVDFAIMGEALARCLFGIE